MTAEERDTVVRALHNMAELINELEPDPEYREIFGVDAVMEQAQAALNIINKQGE